MPNKDTSEENADLLRHLLEHTELLRFTVSRMGEENYKGESDETELLRAVNESLLIHLPHINDLQTRIEAILSTGQTYYYDCQLPYHGPPNQNTHSHFDIKVCKNDSSHKFCANHNLKCCVQCGGDLK
jgi:hypothetical protein